jgi:hypothetical protein
VTASAASSTASPITPITSSASAKLISASSCAELELPVSAGLRPRRQRAIW